jgi:hypothetical protein
MILVLCAAQGVTWLMGRIGILGGWLGLIRERFRPGPVLWAVPILVLVLLPRLRESGPAVPGPFSVYRDTGIWLAENIRDGERALDLTDWSLYFSRRPGYRFAHIYEAPADPALRWVVARRPHLEGHWNYTPVVRALIGDREPVALIPSNPGPGQLQLRIYDRTASPAAIELAKSPLAGRSTH